MSNNSINQYFVFLKKSFKLYLGISIAVFLFILFFQPFSTVLFEFENKLLFIAGIGMIIFVFLLILQIPFLKFLTQTDNELSDNSFSSFVYYFSILTATSLATVFYIRYVGQVTITINVVIRVVIICLSVPITLSINTTQFTLRDRYRRLIQESRLLQEKLKQFSETYSSKYIELQSEKESDTIRILVTDIAFVKSADNYVEIGYRDGAEVKKRMIRNTLKNIEQQLQEFNNFIRTHRTSIVNIQFIEKLNKNFNTYWLSLIDSKELIPVSRQYILAVKDLF